MQNKALKPRKKSGKKSMALDTHTGQLWENCVGACRNFPAKCTW